MRHVFAFQPYATGKAIVLLVVRHEATIPHDVQRETASDAGLIANGAKYDERDC